MHTLASSIGLALSWASTRLGLGAGATWPGEIALCMAPDILPSLLSRITKGIIIVAGTNGKTTTSRLIAHTLSATGTTVLQNASGANLLNGIVSAFFVRTSPGNYDFAVFEVDENALPAVVAAVRGVTSVPITIVLLNLFRDQLDRYGEVDAIASKWTDALSQCDNKMTLIYNADDPQVAFVARNVPLHRIPVGLSDPSAYLKKMQHATDSIYCPSCGTKLVFRGVYYSHLGDWTCPNCTFAKPKLQLTGKGLTSPLEGVYNRYNTLLSYAAVHTMAGIRPEEYQTLLVGFTPAFGRMEEVLYREHTWKILLSKNPTGFNESLRTVLASPNSGPMMLVLNDRIPDGTDISWIWDVDFEELNAFTKPLILTGDRALELSVRLKYAQQDATRRTRDGLISVHPSLMDAVSTCTNIAKPSERIWVLATYSGMLDVRKILTGKKIL